MDRGASHEGRRMPEALDERANPAALRAVATFEAIKGIVVLLLGLGLLSLLHRDVEEAVTNLLMHLHINPDRRLASALLNAAARVTDARLWALAGAAMAYSAVRFTEAWGLWHRRVWAEWFALLSGALYLPWEIFRLAERANLLHIALFTGNLAIIFYMLYIRISACRAPRCEPE